MTEQIVPDSEHRGLVARLPQLPRDLALLARFDRPIGWWLLFWPCVFGVWLAGAGWQFALLGCMLIGSIAMRGAGCVYNDIVDADLDAKVARTALRPVASGRVSKKVAWIWLLALCLIGLVVLLQLRVPAQAAALGSLALVAAWRWVRGCRAVSRGSMPGRWACGRLVSGCTAKTRWHCSRWSRWQGIWRGRC